MPSSIEDAVAALTVEDALAVGGGLMVALLLKERLVAPSRLVWLGRIPELKAVSLHSDGALHIGAGVTLAQLTQSAEVRRCCPSLARAAGEIGNPRVRAVATVGGHLGHADPRQDLPPVLLAHDSRLVTVGRSGRQTIALGRLFAGPMETSLAPDEIITEVIVPPRAGRRASYVRYKPGSEQDYPAVGVAVSLVVHPDGVVADARIALGGVGATALIAADAGRSLVDHKPSPADIQVAAEMAGQSALPTDDQRGSAGYKRAMTVLWTRRALTALLGSAPGSQTGALYIE